MPHVGNFFLAEKPIFFKTVYTANYRLKCKNGGFEGTKRYNLFDQYGPPVILYFQNELPKGADKRYHFSDFTITLNETEPGVAPTDSRLRRDQQLMEDTKWDEANTEKQVTY